MFQCQNPQATTGLPEILSKLHEKSNNLPIYDIIKFRANASVTLNIKMAGHIKKRSISVKRSNVSKVSGTAVMVLTLRLW